MRVTRAQARGDRLGVARLVEARVGEADRERADVGVRRAHAGDHEAGVRAAGEERADRDVGDEPPAHRGADRLERPPGADAATASRPAPGGASTTSAPRPRRCRGRPRSSDAGGSFATSRKIVRGAGHVLEAEVRGQRRPGTASARRARPRSSDFSSLAKCTPPRSRATNSGFLPKRSRASSARAAARVDEREREHAVEALERARAPALERGEHDLGVRARAERVARALELGAQLAEVVDLAVEDERAGRRRRIGWWPAAVVSCTASRRMPSAQPGAGPTPLASGPRCSRHAAIASARRGARPAPRVRPGCRRSRTSAGQQPTAEGEMGKHSSRTGSRAARVSLRDMRRLTVLFVALAVACAAIAAAVYDPTEKSWTCTRR